MKYIRKFESAAAMAAAIASLPRPFVAWDGVAEENINLNFGEPTEAPTTTTEAPTTTTEAPIQSQPNDEIWYTSNDGNIIVTSQMSYGSGTDYGFGDGITVISNTYNNGKGVIKLSDNATRIGWYVFNNSTTLTSITIPNSVTKIANSAFRNCTGLTSITIPDSVTLIDSQAFNGCTGLTSITIPNSVTRLGEYTFGQTGLISITIPASVEQLGEGCFYENRSLTSVVCLRTSAPIAGKESDLFAFTNNCPIYVPVESVNSYKTANGWKSYASRIQAIPA